MKAIFINVHDRTVSPVEIENDLHAMYDKIGCDIVQTVPYENEILVCDEESRLKPWTAGFQDENAIYKVGFSYRCGFWSKLIYTETEDYFLHMSIPESTMNELTDCSDEMKNNIFKSMQTAFGVAEVADEKHAWIEIYGPNTEYGEYEKKGGYKKGDFSIDPWKKGGKEIQYHVDKKIPISTPSRSIHLRRYTTNQKNE